MSTVALREQLQAYIATADDQKIEALHTVLAQEMLSQPYVCDDEEWALIEQARKSMREGKGSSRPWEDVLNDLQQGIVARRAA